MATLLIADKDIEMANVLTDMAHHYGHGVISVDNGRDLLEQLRYCPADLCVIEILLPECDGLETIPQIRRLYPHVKIVAMCEGGIFGRDAAPLFLRMARSLGADRTLTKPFVLHEFLGVVHELLGVHFPRSALRPNPSPP